MAKPITAPTLTTLGRFLADTLKTASTVRDRFQLALDLTLNHAFETERDFGPLNQVYIAARDCKGIDHLRMRRYICASLPVTWRDAKDATSEKDVTKPSTFIKAKKVDGKAPAWELTPNGKWYDYETVKGTGDDNKVSKLDVNNRLTKIIDGLVDRKNASQRDKILIDKKILMEQIRKLQELADSL